MLCFGGGMAGDEGSACLMQLSLPLPSAGCEFGHRLTPSIQQQHQHQAAGRWQKLPLIAAAMVAATVFWHATEALAMEG